MLVQSVNSVTTVQLVATIVVQSGHQVVQENHSLAVTLAQAETLLVQDQTQDQLVESGLQRDLLVMTALLEENGLIQDQLVMIEHLVESGLQKDLLVTTVLLEENGLIQDQLVMTELLVVNGLQRDQLVMTVLLVVSGAILVQLVMTEVQETLADQIAWKEMTTVSVHSMEQETSLQTRRLSLKM
jgi:hypothetical protein